MSSFYGNSGTGNGSGEGGTTNYNELSNKPITNKTGTSSNPIILSDLNSGTYMVTGQCLYTNEDTDIKLFASSTSVTIYGNNDNSNTTAIFQTIEDNIYTIYKITLYEDGTYDEEKIQLPQTYEGTDSSNVIFIDELPNEGTDNVLYIVNDKIYRWKDNNYILLSGSGETTLEWGEY